MEIVLGHMIYNLGVAFLFIYQGWLGLTIRMGRIKGGTRDFGPVRRHRKLGPVLVILAALGYLYGAAMVYSTDGKLLEAPVHHLTGASVVILALLAQILSTRIKGLASPARPRHFLAGLALLAAYAAQISIGLFMLLGSH